MECVAELLEKAIDYFIKHSYGDHYLGLFSESDLRKIEERYDGLHEKLIKPIIIPRLRTKLKDPLIPSLLGELIPLSRAVKPVHETYKFYQEGLVDESDLELLFKEKGLRFIAPDIKLGERSVRELTLEKLNNIELIRKKIKEGKVVDFLAKLYTSIVELYSSMQRPLPTIYTIDENYNIVLAHETYFKTLPRDVIELTSKYPEAGRLLRSMYRFIHPELEEKVGRDVLRLFGVKETNFDRFYKDVVSPKLTDQQPPSREEALYLTALLRKREELCNKRDNNIWVLTKNGFLERSHKVWLPVEDILLEKLGLPVLDLDSYVSIDGDRERWLRWFESCVDIVKLYSPDVKFAHIAVDLIGSILRRLKESNEEEIREVIPLLKHVINTLKTKGEIIKNSYLILFPYGLGIELSKLIDEEVNAKKLYLYTLILRYAWEADKQAFNEQLCVKSDRRYRGLKVLTTSGIMYSTNIFFPQEYKPSVNWSEWKGKLKDEGFEIGPFLSNAYLELDPEVDKWREFFKCFGVIDDDLSVIEESIRNEFVKNFAIAYVKRVLKKNGFQVYDIPREGCDLRVVKDKEYCVEVKGRSILSDVELTETETAKALDEGDQYILAVVANIPINPVIYILRNPVVTTLKAHRGTFKIPRDVIASKGEKLYEG